MCKAIKEMLEDERREGKTEGREEGREEGAVLQTISLVRKKSNKGMNVEEIAQLLEEEEALIRDILEIITSNVGEDDEKMTQIYFEKYKN